MIQNVPVQLEMENAFPHLAPEAALEKEPISKLCDEVGLQPTVFCRWQKESFENRAAAFAFGLSAMATRNAVDDI